MLEKWENNGHSASLIARGRMKRRSKLKNFRVLLLLKPKEAIADEKS